VACRTPARVAVRVRLRLLDGAHGHEKGAPKLDAISEDEAEGSLSEANTSEVFSLVARFQGTADDEPTKASLRDADRDLRTLKRRGLTVRAPSWRLAGEIKADGHISRRR
jgi:hypothetical protein